MKIRKIVSLAFMSFLSVGTISASVVLLNKEEVYTPTFATYENHDADTYYQNISDSLTGNDLLSSLRSLNSTRRKNQVGYSAILFDAGKYTDYDPAHVQYDSNNQPYSEYITGFYSGTVARNASGMNREHVWPNSRGGNYVEKDAHMPRPAIEKENGSRGNSFFVEGEKSSSNGWDPAMESFGDETYRGDSARITFYSVVASDRLSLVDKSNDDTDNNTMGKLSDLIKWHLNYPIAQREMNRNEGAEYLQGNRNPFIDHPEYVCRIWGNTNDATRALCAKDPYGKDAPTSIELNTNSETLKITQTLQLTYTVSPADSDDNVVWTSSNNARATVTEDGFVTAKGLGYVTITATSIKNENVKAVCNINVIEPDNVALEDIALNVSSMTLDQKQARKIAVTTVPSFVYPNASIEFESSNSSVATVDENGNVVGVSAGNATIHVTVTQNLIVKEADVLITINDVPDGSFTINSSSFSNATGNYGWQSWSNGEINGEAYCYGPNIANKEQMQFNSSKDEKSLHNNIHVPGEIKSIKVVGATSEKEWELFASNSPIGKSSGGTSLGTKTVKTTDEGTTWTVGNGYSYFRLDYKDSNAAYLKSVTVNYGGSSVDPTPEPDPITLQSIYVSDYTTSYEVGDAFQFDGKCTALYSDSSAKEVTPTSISEPDMTTSGSKEVNVEYIENNIKVSTSFVIEVDDPEVTEIHVESVSLNKNELELLVGEEEQLNVTILPNDATNKEVYWESNNSDIAGVDDGLIVANAPGTTTIVVTSIDGEISDSCEITVTETEPDPVFLESISIMNNPTKTSYIEDESFDPTGLVIMANYSDETSKTIQLSELDIDALHEDSTFGKVVGNNIVVNISYTEDEITKSTSITVVVAAKPAPEPEPQVIHVESVTLNMTEFEITVGGRYALSYVINPSNADNKNVRWSTSNQNVATVTDGIIITINPGECDITITTEDGNKTATCHVTVKEKESTNVVVSCGGSIVTTSVLLSTVSLLGISLLLFRKKKQ